MTINIHDLFNVPTNVAVKFRGYWNPAGGTLPSTTIYPTGSILVANSQGIISGTTYLINSIILNNNNAWIIIGSGSGAPIQYSSLPNSTDLDTYTGVDSLGKFIYQIVRVLSGAVSTALNLPIQVAGILEVFGEINVQRYTSQTNRVFTRLVGTPNQAWTEISVDISQIQLITNTIYNSQYNTYSMTGIVSN